MSSSVDLESLSVLSDLEKKISLAPKVEHIIMSFETIEIKMAAVSAKGPLTNRTWFSAVCTLIDNDIRHHNEQNVVGS